MESPVTYEVIIPPETIAPFTEATTLEVHLTPDRPTNQIAVAIASGTLGRAEAILESDTATGVRNWSAKHHWKKPTNGGTVEMTVFEFDEPLPAEPMRLLIPFSPRR